MVKDIKGLRCSVDSRILEMICDSANFFNDFKDQRQYLENKIATFAVKNYLETRGIKCKWPWIFKDIDNYKMYRYLMNHFLETADGKHCFEIRSTGMKSGFMIISSDNWQISDGKVANSHNDSVDDFIAVNVERDKINDYLRNDGNKSMEIPQCYIMGVLSADTFKPYLQNHINPTPADDLIPDTNTPLETPSYLFPYEGEGVKYYSDELTTSHSLEDPSTAFKEIFNKDF